ncbi:hypothetical protein [Flavobacterium sp.]|uniref:hypothetical protein n=1 Tax=Flavobacterium sp. TaxID=239 RepID=UPI002BB5F6DF|nr:hypothetical protein [Flavobacterium sp.]HSD05995.1 hypothetical protein [Flavobacterium sp.]
MKKVVLSISAMLFVGAIGFAQANTSVASTVGNGNAANVTQHGTWNGSILHQNGDGNTANAYQGVLPNSYPADHNAAIQLQNGNGNLIQVSQSNKNNFSDQKQFGNSNEAKVWQDQIAASPLGNALGGGDKAWQTQTGDHNKATIDQGTTGNERPTPSTSFFEADALAAANLVVVPFGPNGGNEATQTQNNNWNEALSSQGGTANKSYQTQTNTKAGATSADVNLSKHYAYGEGNTATTVQTGFKLKENTLLIGKLNKSTVTQTGNDHSAISFVSGNSNTHIVTQTNALP